MSYNPSQKVLEKYADVLVNFALGSGKGIKKGDVVYLACYESAKPLMVELRKTILKAGGHIISSYQPDNEPGRYNLSKDFYLLAQDHQLDFFPGKYLRGLIDEADHMIFIDSETDKQALKGINPKKIMKARIAFKPYIEWRDEKENKGKFSWAMGLYGTEAMAKESKMSLKEYWEQIIKACFLDKKNPINEWKSVFKQTNNFRQKLKKLQINRLHVSGPEANLWIKIGAKRIWRGGGGRNIPSFEIFTSPDWRGTNGWIKFNQPLYSHGNLITGINLEFRNGKVVKSRAKKNEKLLKEIIKTEGGDKVGEFSLTDKRGSRIAKCMAETVYDENIGGPNCNMHIALGTGFHDCYDGNPAKLKKKDWKNLGFNDSAIHSDIITTSPRTVTAFLRNGKEKIIYKDGMFVI